VVDDRELEEQMRRRILGEAAAAQVVTPSQLQPMLRDNTLTCKKGMLYVVAGLVLVGIVLGVALPLTLGEGSAPSMGGINEPSVTTNSSSTEAPTDIGFLSENSKLTANFSDGAAGDWFGISVAIDGDTMVVGVPFGDDFSGIEDIGSAFVFTRTGTTWTQQAKLTASDGAADDQFGYSVAIAGDTIVVGSHFDDDNGSSSGSAYIFTRTGTTWTEQAKLTASDGAAVDGFGFSVAIANDTIVIGANEGDAGGSNSGSAYVFTLSTETTWTQQAKLTSSDSVGGDNFGNSVAIAGDTIVVGAYRDDDNGTDSGSAHVFTRTGTMWMEQAKLMASDGATYDVFGRSVAIAGDTIVVGADEYDFDNNLSSGSAYVYTRTGTTWTEQAKLTASDGAAGAWFGYSVAIAGDTIVVGAIFDNAKGFESGSAYIFTRTGFTWTQQAQLVASDGGIGHGFGISVAIANDTIVVGAWAADDEFGRDTGSAYVYDLN